MVFGGLSLSLCGRANTYVREKKMEKYTWRLIKKQRAEDEVDCCELAYCLYLAADLSHKLAVYEYEQSYHQYELARAQYEEAVDQYELAIDNEEPDCKEYDLLLDHHDLLFNQYSLTYDQYNRTAHLYRNTNTRGKLFSLWVSIKVAKDRMKSTVNVYNV